MAASTTAAEPAWEPRPCYARFPTREDLIAATTVAGKMISYAQAIDTALADPVPWHGFCCYLEEVCSMQAAARGCWNVLTLTFPAAKSFQAERNRAHRGFTEFIRRARPAGKLRPDFSAEELPPADGQCGRDIASSGNTPWTVRTATTMNDTDLRKLLEGVTTIAVVGASTNAEKASNQVPRFLIDAGYTVIPVHPKADEILGRTAYRTLAEIPGPVDIVDLFRPAAEAPELARQATAIGAGTLWLQLGITSPDAKQLADQAGLTYLEDICIGATTRRLGVHPRT